MRGVNMTNSTNVTGGSCETERTYKSVGSEETGGNPNIVMNLRDVEVRERL
jgi:hypothetical protein